MTTLVPVSISRRERTLVVVLAGLLAAPVTAGAQVADALRCEREIAKRSTKLVQLRVKTVRKCEDRVLRGGGAGPCPDAAGTARIDKRGARLARAIDKRCGGRDRTCGTGDDLSLDTIGWDLAACPNLAGAACTAPIGSCAETGKDW